MDGISWRFIFPKWNVYAQRRHKLALQILMIPYYALNSCHGPLASMENWRKECQKMQHFQISSLRHPSPSLFG